MFRKNKGTEAIVRAGVNEHYVSLWRYALSLSGSKDQADDIAQAAALRAIEKHHLFEPGTKIKNWLFRIAHNLWISEIRRQKVRTGNGVVGIETMDVIDPQQDVYATLAKKELISAVLKLPEAQRETVVLVYGEGFSYQEAADILEIPVGTTRSRLAAARKTLSQQLNESDECRNAS